MKIGIIGAGSIGLLFASYLSKTFEVNLYTRTVEQAADINQYGILIKKGSEQSIAIVNACPVREWAGLDDFTIIAVKQYQLQSIIETIRFQSMVCENFLFLQNGMGHLKWLENIPAKNLFVGTVEHGALKEGSNVVYHNGVGITNAAVLKGKIEPLRHFSDLTPKEFPILVKKDYREMMVNKLIVNAVINPLTAILGVKNGALIQNQYYYKVLVNLFLEICNILGLENQEIYLEQVLKICQNTANNRSSMLKDIEAGRLTEIEAILGYLLDEAAKQKKHTPQIEIIYYLIKGKEQDERGDHL
ncbi:2-dehydropantoate 2-reductase [Neobacillus thermocopriae]|uniref:2-dehydropantoate 2-reductase n=1 Tax=Neobacillus thermocopriae TaxID=1215031 RepID=A0A6B3TKX6_9BACI|nr:2-dehydropantoate 2-reductase [Neobacillus thermocopriae]MED3624331.1 2-dehydropantoate 2-reductase [Neobacillus thermocopriae]MED3713474.1 2-dehydropantoate 2-reductase [Neobacillus thermocopriae]NEX77584.1 2-dehydropantoate 2-reductase [Neobacillus thermocopriae]